MNSSPASGYGSSARTGAAPVRLSPFQPASELVDALHRAEWHGTNRRWHAAMLNVLRAIASLLAENAAADAAGAGEMTQVQIAGRAYVDERTVRRWLPVLVRLQLIAWAPGVPAVGTFQARPGHVRVHKKRVIAFVALCRRLKDAARDAHHEAVRARLVEQIRDARAFWASRLRRSAKADTNVRPSLPQEGGGTEHGPPGDPWATCEHDHVPGKCPTCRRRRRTST